VLNQVKHNPFPELKFKIYHNRKNVIELQSSEESSESDELNEEKENFNAL
jgi:hypothetical protein